MKHTIETLGKYSSCYEDWREQFMSASDELARFSGDSEEFFMLLLEKLLPLVKHQYTLYSSILPALECLSEIVEKDNRYLEDTVHFFEHVFQSMIRDKNLILVEPRSYEYLAPHLIRATQDEEALFGALQEFYTKHRPLIVDAGFTARYDVLLLNTIENTVPQFGDNLAVLKWLLANSLARFKSEEDFISDQNISPIGMEFEDVVFAIQGRKFSENVLLELLANDVSANISWAGGRMGAVSGLLLFLDSQTRSAALQKKVLCDIVERCIPLKKKYLEEGLDLVSTDQFLLEDISTLLFLEYRGATEKVSISSLNDRQKTFLDLMKNIYRGHTYSLLYAGIGPGKMKPVDISQIPNIYAVPLQE